MTDFKFYYAPGACSLAPHILLHETGIQFEGIPNIVNKDEVKFVGNFASINPKMRVPVLIVDGQVITETPAILATIARYAPSIDQDLSLMGQHPLEAAKILEWLCWLSGTVHGHAFGGSFRPERLTDDASAFDGIKEKALVNIKNHFETIEGKLNGGYAVGDRFTAVDAYLFVFYRWANGMGIEMKKLYPKYTALATLLAARPSVIAAMEVEGIKPTL